tara:strand:+ start:76 stop:594 length:519 start_codon:yes stop_codon:yes gene_type:complete
MTCQLTKFQCLTKLADKWELCDEIIDRIYQKLKLSELWSPIGQFSLEGVSGEWSEAKFRIQTLMTRTWKDLPDLLWAPRTVDYRKVLLNEREDLRLNPGRCFRLIKIDSDISVQVRDSCVVDRELVYVYNEGLFGKELNKLLKKDLQNLCETRGITFKNSWKKSLLVEELVK